jgi:hypothetical protein
MLIVSLYRMCLLAYAHSTCLACTMLILLLFPKHLEGLYVFIVVSSIFFFEEWHQQSQAVQDKLKRRVMSEHPIS